jgi:hypothetical protein
MSELGIEKSELQLPQNLQDILPEKLHPYFLEEFDEDQDERYKDPWLIEHYHSIDPETGGDIILMYNKHTLNCFEVNCKRDQDIERRDIIEVSKTGLDDRTRQYLGQLIINHKDRTTQFLDQNPNDQQL